MEIKKNDKIMILGINENIFFIILTLRVMATLKIGNY
jgi:hypothetical protein